MLLITFAALFLWFFFGFDIPEGWVPVIGIQWSTFATFAFFFYVLMVNFQNGGITTSRWMIAEVEYDLRFLADAIQHPKGARARYDNWGDVDGVRAALASFSICFATLFLFEDVWVPLYDYFQFGSLTWPVYFAQRVSSILTTPVFIRNMLLFPLWMIVGFLILKAFAIDGPKTELHFRYFLKPRIDRSWLIILAFTAYFWIAWIALPHQTLDVSKMTASDVLGPVSKTFALSNCYVFPTQGLFPQNSYTFYPCSTHLQPYKLAQIGGFFVPDFWVHLINVLTKYMTFLSACYPAMAFVRRNRE